MTDRTEQHPAASEGRVAGAGVVGAGHLAAELMAAAVPEVMATAEEARS